VLVWLNVETGGNPVLTVTEIRQEVDQAGFVSTAGHDQRQPLNLLYLTGDDDYLLFP
jgi:hypothetical protein